MNDLTQRDQHFEFGENWINFSQKIDDDAITLAVDCLRDLIGVDIEGQSFLDIGCGSGLSSLAAIRLGAAPVVAADLDENSVNTARGLLRTHAPEAEWSVNLYSAFDLDPAKHGHYDVVYSWGVLHHTGDMWRAIRKAAALVKPKGRFVVAIYQRTPLCGFWRWEKRIYNRSPEWLAAIFRGLYKSAYMVALVLTGRNPVRYIREYNRSRGMNWSNDVHDWLGGYPYESASLEEIDAYMSELGFVRENVILAGQPRLGLFGSGCNQFVYRHTRVGC